MDALLISDGLSCTLFADPMQIVRFLAWEELLNEYIVFNSDLMKYANKRSPLNWGAK